MIAVDKRAIIGKCCAAARSYKDNLLGTTVLFVHRDGAAAGYFEATFGPEHFAHLTGLKPNHGPERGVTSRMLFELAAAGELAEADVAWPRRLDLVEMKLEVLPAMTRIDTSARMTGEHDDSPIVDLRTDRLAGNVAACMGFVWADDSYVPNTVLKADIRNLTADSPQRILAVWKKPAGSPASAYAPSRLAKGMDEREKALVEGVLASLRASDAPSPRSYGKPDRPAPERAPSPAEDLRRAPSSRGPSRDAPPRQRRDPR